MRTIRLETWMDAPLERCFQLALSVELDLVSTQDTGKRAVEGVKTGLRGAGDTVKWRGRHFGLWLSHTSRIDGFRPPMYFREVMVEGVFQRYEHEHHFAATNDGTRMRDEIRFSAPGGPLGLVAEKTWLRTHLIGLVKQRNAVIKRVAESEEWRWYLEGKAEVERVAEGGGGESMATEWERPAILRA